MMKKKLSFIIPCYGSEKTIANVVDEIKTTLRNEGAEYDYEIILVNDHSPDKVYSVICKLAKEDNKIKGIDLARNFGQHAALMAGFNHVTGDIIICLDDDGQSPANQMFRLINRLDDDCDVVFASYSHKKHSFFRNLGSKINDHMARSLLNKPKNLQIMSFFACKRYIADEVMRYDKPYPYMSGLLLRSTKNIANVEVDHRERESGSSGYNFKKLFSLWVNGFTAFSVRPLRIATLLGVLCAGVGFLYGIYIIINKFINPLAPLGYSSMMAVFLFVGGIIMLMLGLIGEYVGRIYISLNKAPQYVIRQSVNIEKNSEDSNA